MLRGTFRCLQKPVRDRIKTLISDLVTALPSSFGVTGEVTFSVGYPVTRNHAIEAEKLRTIAVNTLGAKRVHSDIPPSMSSEDFAFMLEACPGAYFWLGADRETPSRPLHNASDALIGPGTRCGMPLSKLSCPSSHEPQFSTFFRHVPSHCALHQARRPLFTNALQILKFPALLFSALMVKIFTDNNFIFTGIFGILQ